MRCNNACSITARCRFCPCRRQMPTPDEEQTALQRRMRGEPPPPPAKGGRPGAAVDRSEGPCLPPGGSLCHAGGVPSRAESRPRGRHEHGRYHSGCAAGRAGLQSRLSLTRTLPWATTGETTGGRDDSDYTETFNTDPTMGDYGHGKRRVRILRSKAAGRRPRQGVYTQVRITPQEGPPAARSRRETLPIGTCVLPSRAGSKTGGIPSACLALVLQHM